MTQRHSDVQNSSDGMHKTAPLPTTVTFSSSVSHWPDPTENKKDNTQFIRAARSQAKCDFPDLSTKVGKKLWKGTEFSLSMVQKRVQEDWRF